MLKINLDLKPNSLNYMTNIMRKDSLSNQNPSPLTEPKIALVRTVPQFDSNHIGQHSVHHRELQQRLQSIFQPTKLQLGAPTGLL
jgi:hypothetical protein